MNAFKNTFYVFCLNRSGLLFFLILLSISRLHAGNSDSTCYPELNVKYLKSYFSDSKSFFVSPVQWKGKQWIEFGAITAAGVLAYSQDEKVQNYFVNHQSQTADNFSKFVFEPYGRFAPVIIGGLYIGGRLAKDNRLAGTSLTAAKSFIVASVSAGIVKQLTHRHRPFQDAVPEHANWDGPFSKIEYTSFPSGHSTAAFSMATVFAMEYSHTLWVPVLAYSLATGTAISRLYDNKHWASDVVLGSALGFLTGRFMWKQCHKSNNKLVVLPDIGTQTASLLFIVRLSEP